MGHSVNVLIDSGATTSFVNSTWCEQHSIELETLAAKDVLNVRLGNNALEKVTRFMEGEVFLGNNIAYKIRPHAMRLPVDCHIVAGLDFMDEYDCWLHPPSRTVKTVVDGVPHVIASMRAGLDENGFMQLTSAESLETFGAYKTSNSDWDVQSCSQKQFQSYLRAFSNGNLSYSVVTTQEERLATANCAHLASDASSEAVNADSMDSDPVDSASHGCESDPGVTGKPGISSEDKRTVDDSGIVTVDEEVFKVIVQFHPDGTHSVLSGEDEEIMEADMNDTADLCYSADTECKCASIFPDTSASRPKARNMMINTQGASTRSTTSDPLRTDNSVNDLPVDTLIEPLVSSHPRRSELRLSSVQRKMRRWCDDPETYLQHVFSMSQEHEALVGKYPINEADIDVTEAAFADWCNSALHHEFGHFTCLERIKRWEALESDPLLKIHLKEGMHPTPMKYRIPVHMLPQLKEFVTDMLEKNFIVPNPGSTFSSPMLVLAKPRNADGTSRGFRLVTDFRSLNKCIDAPQFWQQDIGLAQEKLRGAKYLSTLDMRDGYWNAGVDKASQDLLSFATPWGTFSYQVLPRGLVSSAQWFQNWTELSIKAS